MQPSICVMITQSPYGTVPAAEAVRHVNGALSEGFRVVTLLVDDGVWVAHAGQNPGQTGFTSLSDALVSSLQRESAPEVLVHRQSAEERGLTPADMIAGVGLVDDAGLGQIITSAQFLLRF